MTAGYSDRIAHALAFVAKYQAGYPGRGPGAGLLAPANVAVILARHGADEDTIVAGILMPLLNEASAAPRAELVAKTQAKFGPVVAEILHQVVEPRYDARGRERSWEAIHVECVAGLAEADRRGLDVAAAHQILFCGTVLTEVRRLGVEYLTAYAPGGAASVLESVRDVVTAMSQHPEGPRPTLLAEVRLLLSRLQTAFSDD